MSFEIEIKPAKIIFKRQSKPVITNNSVPAKCARYNQGLTVKTGLIYVVNVHLGLKYPVRYNKMLIITECSL